MARWSLLSENRNDILLYSCQDIFYLNYYLIFVTCVFWSKLASSMSHAWIPLLSLKGGQQWVQLPSLLPHTLDEEALVLSLWGRTPSWSPRMIMLLFWDYALKVLSMVPHTPCWGNGPQPSHLLSSPNPADQYLGCHYAGPSISWLKCVLCAGSCASLATTVQILGLVLSWGGI